MSGFYWLASYPKSGNTWLRLALWSLERDGAAVDFANLQGLATIASARQSFDAVLGVESSDLTPDEIAILRPRVYEDEAARAQKPILRKVHDAWTLTPAGEPLFPAAATLGAVYLTRDPRDLVISLAHHTGSTIDDQIFKMADPAAISAPQRRSMADQLPQRCRDWSSHVESWLAAPGRPALLVRYEDMLTDPAAALARVAAYFGWTPNPQTVERTVAATAFPVLRAEEERHGFRERQPDADRFFRQGRAGGWRHALTAEQAHRIEQAHGRVMTRLGYL